MRLCLMIEGQEGVTWDQWLALADACERSGLEGLFRSDHYTAPRSEPGALDAWTTLAGLAARTSRIRLGSMVSPATFRHPTVLAKSAVTVDHISGGRVELGMGAGWMEEEHRAYGFDFPPLPERLELFAEQLEIVHRLWSEDEVRFDGRHYRFEGARGRPRPLQQPHPPLIVGGGAKRGTLEPAVRFADEYDTTHVSPDEAGRRKQALDAACERAGRDPKTIRFSVMTGCVVGRDDDEVRRRAQRLMERYRPGSDLDRFIAERREPTLIGTVDEVVERLHAYEAAGVERMYLQHLLHDDVEMVELLGEAVLPRVAS